MSHLIQNDTGWEEKLAKFRGDCRTTNTCLKIKTRNNTCIKFYKTIPIPTFLYSSGIWSLSKREEKKIEVGEMKFLGSTQRYSLLRRRY